MNILVTSATAALTAAAIGFAAPAIAAEVSRAAQVPTLFIPVAPVAGSSAARRGMSPRARVVFAELAAENKGNERGILPPAGTLIYSAKPIPAILVRR